MFKGERMSAGNYNDNEFESGPKKETEHRRKSCGSSSQSKSTATGHAAGNLSGGQRA